jgi:hypothetical protein
MGKDMKMEKETNEPLKSTETVKQSALEEFLDEWGSWRGKKKAAKVERDSHIVQPRGKARKKPKRLEDSWWYMGLKLCGIMIEGIAEMVMILFSFLFSFKTLAIIAAIYYWVDFDIDFEVLNKLGEQGIEQTESALEAVKQELDGIQIEIKKTDGTVHKFGGGDIDEWFTTETKEPDAVPFTQAPLKPTE